MSGLWKSMREFVGLSRLRKRELNKSSYSMVSTEELTQDTIKLWLGLPPEVRLDPALEPFRKLYERENGNLELTSKSKDPERTDTKSRLPLVKSAPTLDNLKDVAPEIEICNGNKEQSEKEGSQSEDVTEKTDEVLCQGSNSASPSPFSHNEKGTKMSRARHYIKITVLLACWVFFTVVFLLYGEKEVTVRNTAVNPGEVKSYLLHPSEKLESILVKLSGPFLSENGEMSMNSNLSQMHKMMVWVEDDNYSQILPPSVFYLQEDLDFNIGEPRSAIFELESNSDSNHTWFIKMNASETRTIPFTLSYSFNPLDATTGLVYSVILLFGLYILIIFEVINRTMAAIVMATLSLSALAIAGERPNLTEIVSWLDGETLLLLFSMMILVAIMAETGIFDFLAVYAFEVTKGRLWPLIFLLCTLTAVLSTFLDNVTTVLLMSPVTIRLCEVMDLDPVPILMFMVIYSNIGGTATPVGDPPCIIVASNKAVVKAGIDFTTFTAHMSLGVFLVFIQTSLQFRWMYRDTNKLRLKEPREIQELRQQISIWRRAADSLPGLSSDVAVVRDRLERKITKLNAKLHQLRKENRGRACPRQQYAGTLQELKEKYKIRDKKLLVKAAVAIGFVVVLFFLHSLPELRRISLSWTALLGAILLLLLADREDLEPILHRVEWSTLLFFAALFVLMEALSKLGLILYIGRLMEQLVLRVDESSRLAVAIMLTLWVSGVISACVDNIPLTTMMIRVVVSMGTNPTLNLPMGPLVWALKNVFNMCNGTLIGASANVVCAGVAEQHGYKFTFMRFLKNGMPIMVGHLIVGTAYLLVCHCVFHWH